jgi:hypothetical protein
MSESKWSFSLQTLIVPKYGNTASECEDALGFSVVKRRFCLADGATEGFDSRRWARLLVKHWTATVAPVTSPELFEEWVRKIGERFERRWRSRQLPWFAEEKAESGAFAAFVGLIFYGEDEHLAWTAIAKGDSCLLVRRGDRLVHSFPIDDPNAFGNSPTLIASRLTSVREAPYFVLSARAEEGDRFMLLSDAIAAWYLRAFQNEPDQALAFEQLMASNRQDEVIQLVACNRTAGMLRNDDVAALLLSVEKRSQ